MKVVITDYWYESLCMEKAEFAKLPGLTLREYQCKDEETLVDLVRDADAVVVQFAPITKRVIDAMERCKLIVRYAIGVDNIDVDAATARGIYVANVPDYGIDEVSNHAVTLLLALSKMLIPMADAVKAGRWDYTTVKPLFRMRGKTLGLVGFGRIPVMVAEKMRGFGVKMLCYDPYVNAQAARDLGVTPVDLDTLLEESDYISIHCPLNDTTRHMFGDAQFGRMKPGAILVNTARGAVVDEQALIRALQEKKIAAAGLDVLEREPIAPQSPLLSMPNVIVTPHAAWYSEDATLTLQRMVGEEVVRVLSGNPPKNLVNKTLLER
ncbi:C-terminal binding protein [Anaerotruncus rubiinfantis]|uniref:C-terminal binding protein n=1 Tax=Anaerotruncus rubiinfantis TaxID=1720200 RepID=UPI0034A4F44F